MPLREHSYYVEMDPGPAHGGEGTLLFGPISRMSRRELLVLMERHSLTTGFDLGIRLKVVGVDQMCVIVSGREIAGYFLERGGYGLEASEEDVEAFLLDVTRPGTVMSIIGQSLTDQGVEIVSRSSHVRAETSISTSAIRHRRSDEGEQPIMVISNMTHSRFEKVVGQRAAHLHLVPKVEMA